MSCIIEIQLKPNARRNRVLKIEGACVHVSVAAPPVEGKANKALVEYLADVLNTRKSAIDIVRGAASRRKALQIAGMQRAEVLDKLASSLTK
jgi:uncharacterized protein (TIGR00251 family)